MQPKVPMARRSDAGPSDEAFRAICLTPGAKLPVRANQPTGCRASLRSLSTVGYSALQGPVEEELCSRHRLALVVGRTAPMLDETTLAAIAGTVDPARVLELEQALIRIPSSTFREHDIADYLAGYLEQLGLQVE